MRKLLMLVLVAGVLGAGVAVIPALAASSSPPSTASFKALDFKWEANGGAATQVTIAQGGTVTFSYPSGSSQHNADFFGGPQPSSCTQTAGPNSGAVPPLPHSVERPGWSGSCTFNTPGTYKFHCNLHPFMTGTIVVQGSGTTTSTTQSSGTTTPSSTTTSTKPSAPPPRGLGGSPLRGGTARGIVVARRQRGTAVRVAVKISATGADGRLVANLFASRAALRLRPRRGTVRVGHLARRSLHAGTVRLSIPLDAAARRALRIHRPLRLTVHITVRSPLGASAAATRRVLLRRS